MKSSPFCLKTSSCSPHPRSLDANLCGEVRKKFFLPHPKFSSQLSITTHFYPVLRLCSLKVGQGSLLRSLPHRRLWMTLEGASGDPSWISLLGGILCFCDPSCHHPPLGAPPLMPVADLWRDSPRLSFQARSFVQHQPR